jgi:hypothetical protein
MWASDIRITNGTVSAEPPPATALMKPAPNPAKKRRINSSSVSYTFDAYPPRETGVRSRRAIGGRS